MVGLSNANAQDQLWELHLCSAAANALQTTTADGEELDELLNELSRAISPTRAPMSSRASVYNL